MTQPAPEPAPAPSNGPAPAAPAPAPNPQGNVPAPAATANPPTAIDPAEYARLRAEHEAQAARLRETARELGTLRKERETAQEAGQSEAERQTSRANAAEQRAEQAEALAMRVLREQAVFAAAKGARYRNPTDAIIALGGSGAMSSIEIDTATLQPKDPKAVERLVQEAITPDRSHWLLPEGVSPGDPPSAPQFAGQRKREPGEMNRERAIAQSGVLRGLIGGSGG
jgi:signal transduction histidine kinase